MKVRTGFVSNSSSSSFVVVGNALTWAEALEGGENLYAIGEWLSDGQDIFKLTPEVLDVVRARGEPENCWPCKTYTAGEGQVELVRSVLPERVTVYAFEIDYHSVESAEEFVERYYENS